MAGGARRLRREVRARGGHVGSARWHVDPVLRRGAASDWQWWRPAGKLVAMPLDGEYEPSPAAWVRDQVAEYESSGGIRGTTLRDMPVIVLTTRGAKSGKIRKSPLMRVEHAGSYAIVASKGGAPENPVWFYNVVADPHVELQDGPVRQDMVARQVTGAEKAEWWDRAVAAYPDYADYQKKTDRQIPVFVVEPARA